jgi:N-acetylglucosamine malate deacetylase 1
MERILCFGVHPDDETLGAGATLWKHAKLSHEVHICNVTRGDPLRIPESVLESNRRQAIVAHRLLGAAQSHFLDFSSTLLDTIPHRELVEAVKNIIDLVRPTVVYTHFWRDVNLEHRVFSEAVEVCLRPKPDSCVKKVIAYYTPSSTDWGHFMSGEKFMPNMFVACSEEALDAKVQAMEAYKSEIQLFPHPRSSKSLITQAAFWGTMIGVERAEPFMLVRDLDL